MSERALVTGLGVAAPGGVTVADHWKAVLAGRMSIGPVSGFDAGAYTVRLAGQVDDFDPTLLPKRLLPQTDRVTRLALVATEAALAEAGVADAALDSFDEGVVLANAQGGSDFTHREFKKLWTAGPSSVSVYESFAWFYAANTGQVSIRHGMRGPSGVLVGEQSGGLDAIGLARRRIVEGGARLMVTGGFDSAMDPWGFLSQSSHGRLSRATDPRLAYRPFDPAADGYVAGEGGATLVLEAASSVRHRGVPAYGEIAGYAATFDPRPGSGRPPALRRAIELALADAGTGTVDVVFADSAGVPELDRIEAAAITAVFGPRGVPVTAPKAGFGRLGAGGGPVDVLTGLLSLRHSVIPPTPHTGDVPDEDGLDLVLETPRECRISSALVIGRGYGGFNSAVVIRGNVEERQDA